MLCGWNVSEIKIPAAIFFALFTAMATDPVLLVGAMIIGGAFLKHRWVLIVSLLYAIPLAYFVAYSNGFDFATVHPFKIFVRFCVILAVADFANMGRLLLQRSHIA